MKRLLLLLTLLLAACTDSLDDSPKTRTVYFLTATLEKTGKDVCVMVDSMDTDRLCLMMTTGLAAGINLPWIGYPCPDQLRNIAPFYDYPLSGGYAGEFRFFVGSQRYSEVGLQADFSRQERITGQHIDIVIGGDGVRRMFNNDLSQLPIDKTMVVPYDWGVSQE